MNRPADEPRDNVVPLSHAWVDVDVKLPPKRPRIAPGRYEARSASLKRAENYRRQTLEIGFDVYNEGGYARNVILAQIPLFVTLPGPRGLSPNSKLARLFYQLGHAPSRWTRVNLSLLKDKLWMVTVGDVTHDSANALLTPSETYSVILHVPTRLA